MKNKPWDHPLAQTPKRHGRSRPGGMCEGAVKVLRNRDLGGTWKPCK